MGSMEDLLQCHEFGPSVDAPGGGQYLGHLYKAFFYFSVMGTTYADNLSDMAQPCDIDL